MTQHHLPPHYDDRLSLRPRILEGKNPSKAQNLEGQPPTVMVAPMFYYNAIVQILPKAKYTNLRFNEGGDISSTLYKA